MGERENRLTIVSVLYAPPHLGGSGYMGLQLCRSLAKRGHSVHIVSYSGTSIRKEDGQLITHHAVPDIQYGSFKTAPIGLTFPGTIARLSERVNIDILHAHYAVTHGEAVIDARDIINRRKLRTGDTKLAAAVISCHGTDVTINGHRDVMAPGLELRLSQADATTYVAEALQKEARKLFNLEDYGKVIYNFVDRERFFLKENVSDAVRSRHNLDTSKILFYHFSNLRGVKNVEHILAATHRLISTGHHNFHVMVGGDGETMLPLQEQVGQLGVSNYVSFVGVIDETQLPEYTRAGDILVIPSQTEACSLAILEAMHVGNPVIASKVGGTPEIVRDNYNGFMFPVGDINSLTNRMARFLKQPSLIRTMGLQGAALAAKRFEPDRIISEYEEVFFKALARVRS